MLDALIRQLLALSEQVEAALALAHSLKVQERQESETVAEEKEAAPVPSPEQEAELAEALEKLQPRPTRPKSFGGGQ